MIHLSQQKNGVAQIIGPPPELSPAWLLSVSTGSRGVRRKGSNGVSTYYEPRVRFGELTRLGELRALLMMPLKNLCGLRQFRTVWIGGFPDRQEFPVSHPRGLFV